MAVAFPPRGQTGFPTHLLIHPPVRIYYSGISSLKQAPESLIPELKPHVMLSFLDIQTRKGRVIDRVKVNYLNRQNKSTKSSKNANRQA